LMTLMFQVFNLFASTNLDFRQQRDGFMLDAVKHLGVTSVDFECMFYTTQDAVDRTRAMIPLPYRPKEEDQTLPDELRQVDPDVFMVVSDTREVMGTRIGNQPHW